MNNNVELRLTINNAEALRAIGVTQDQLNELLRGAETVNAAALSAFAQELIAVGNSSEGAVQGITELIQANQLSENAIADVIKMLQTEQSQLSITSESYKKINTAVTNTRTALNNMSSSAQGGVPGLNNMNQAVGQFGWVLGDANMFLVNFRMGMMSIANNIPMVVQAFVQAKQAAGANASMFSLLAQSLTGMGGVMLAINAVMFAMQLFSAKAENTTEAIQKQTKSVRELTDEYSELTRAQMQNEYRGAQMELALLDNHPGEKGYWAGEYGAKFKYYTDEERYGENAGKAKELKSKITALERSYFLLGDIQEIENRLAINREKQRKLSKENWQYFVPNAESYEKAKAAVEDWVKTDEARLDKQKGKTSQAGKRQAEDVQKLSNELLLLEKIGLDKRLEEIKHWYAEKSKLAHGDAELEKRLLAQKVSMEKEAYREEWRGIDKITGKPAQSMYTSIEDQKKLLGNLVPGDTMKPVAEPPKPAAFQETQLALSTTLNLTTALQEGFYSAGEASVRAMSQSIMIFKEANSVLQNFVNTLAQVAFQVAAMQIFKGIFSFFTGGGFMAGFTALADGGIVTRPTISLLGEYEPEAVIPLSRFNSVIAGGASFDKAIEKINNWQTQLSFEIGFDKIYTANKRYTDGRERRQL